MKHRNLLIFLLITGKDIDTITWKPLLAADLIKALLRELPEPLLTYAFYEPFILLACMYSPTIKPVQSHSLSPIINKAQKDVETRLVKVGTSSKKLLLTLTTSSPRIGPSTHIVVAGWDNQTGRILVRTLSRCISASR